MAEMVLRLKCRAGTFPLTVPLNLAISDLREQVSALSDIPAASVKLLLGFPPRVIQQSEGLVRDTGLKSGDTIIAEADPSNAAASAAATAASAAAAVQSVKAETETNTRRHVTEQETGDEVPLILRKIVPADNSCLFTSMGFVMGGNWRLGRAFQYLPRSKRHRPSLVDDSDRCAVTE